MKISVVTISLNPGLSLNRTINSILSQNYPNIEWVVVDGGSTDGTLETYKKLLMHIDKFVYEDDEGIADAMNKGLLMASGDAVIYMNAGDEFADSNILKKITENWDIEKYQWATGGGRVYDSEGRFLYERSNQNEFCEDLVNRGCRILHAATIVKRSTLIAFKGFSCQFKSSMDYELWLRLIHNGTIPQLLTFPVSNFYLGGVSGNVLRRYREDYEARKLYGYSKWILECELFLIAALKHFLKPFNRFRSLYLLKEWLKI